MTELDRMTLGALVIKYNYFYFLIYFFKKFNINNNILIIFLQVVLDVHNREIIDQLI